MGKVTRKKKKESSSSFFRRLFVEKAERGLCSGLN